MALMACGHSHAPEEHHHHDEHEHEEHEHDHESHHHHEEHEHDEHHHDEHEHEEHGHDHASHNHENLLLAAYSADAELFAEMHPLVLGSESEMVCKFTRLKDFKPIDEGEVEAELIVGDKHAIFKSEGLHKPGTCHIDLEPEEEGDAKIVVRLKTKDLETEFVLKTKVFDHEHEAAEYAEEMEKKSPNGVTFGKELSWGVEFETQEVKMQKTGKVIRSIAQILPSIDNELTVSAKASGIAELSGRLSLGAQVSQQELICTIDASQNLEGNINMELQKAESEFSKAKAEYERIKALRDENLALESELQESKLAYENAQSQYNALKQNFKKGKQEVKALKGGYIKQILIGNGEYVSVGQPIAVITNSKSLRLQAEVQSGYYGDLKDIVSANIRKINSQADAQSLESLGGKLVSYGRQVSSTSTLIPVTFEINNVGNYLPGTYVEIFMKTQSQGEKLTAPSSSIVEDMGSYFVYVQLTPELFEKRQVKIGDNDGLSTEIVSGLSQGERVVSKGAMLVKLQQASGSVDPHAGHNHAH